MIEHTREYTFGLYLKDIIGSVADLHFEAGYYHGDLRPDNIFTYLPHVTSPRPMIGDFNHMFKKETPTFNPRFIMYHPKYRPPELLDIVTTNSIQTRDQAQAFSLYKFNPEFKEESYVLGKTLKRIYFSNIKHMNSKSEFLQKLQRIILALCVEDIDKRVTSLQAKMKIDEYLEEQFSIITGTDPKGLKIRRIKNMAFLVHD